MNGVGWACVPLRGNHLTLQKFAQCERKSLVTNNSTAIRHQFDVDGVVKEGPISSNEVVSVGVAITIVEQYFVTGIINLRPCQAP